MENTQTKKKYNFLTVAGITLATALTLSVAAPSASIFADDITNRAVSINDSDANSVDQLDKYVIVSHNQYKLMLPTGYDVSSDVLNEAQAFIDQSNKFVSDNGLTINTETKVATYNEPNANLFVSLAAAKAKYVEGKTKFDLHWNYVRVYISRSTANAIKGGAIGVAGVVAGKVPNIYTELVAAAILGVVGVINVKGGFWFDYNYVGGNQGMHWQ